MRDLQAVCSDEALHHSPASIAIRTRMGSEVTIKGRALRPGWVVCLRHSDQAIKEFHELDLRAAGGLAEIQAAVAATSSNTLPEGKP